MLYFNLELGACWEHTLKLMSSTTYVLGRSKLIMFRNISGKVRSARNTFKSFSRVLSKLKKTVHSYTKYVRVLYEKKERNRVKRACLPLLKYYKKKMKQCIPAAKRCLGLWWAAAVAGETLWKFSCFLDDKSIPAGGHQSRQ